MPLTGAGVDRREGDSQDVPGVTGVDEPVVADSGGREVGLLLMPDLRLDHGPSLLVGVLVEGSPL